MRQCLTGAPAATLAAGVAGFFASVCLVAHVVLYPRAVAKSLGALLKD